MTPVIKLLADRDIFGLKQALPENAELSLFNPLDGLPDNVGLFDALMVRSITRLNASAIGTQPSRLKFIASATAGTDHVDTEFLKDRGITFYNSAGCNARAVAEYVITALLLWAENEQRDLSDINVGLIGAGNTGSAVSAMLDRMGITWKALDPPKELRDDTFESCTREELFGCEVLSFHVPLTLSGEFATHHWLNRDILEEHSFELIINAARGGVVEETALLNASDEGTVGRYVLDVWENEPLFSDAVAEKALYRTPHIAGYSIQSKWKATLMAVEAMARFFDIDHLNRAQSLAVWGDEENRLPAGGRTTRQKETSGGEKTFQEDGLPEKATLAQLITSLHPIREYDRRLAELIGREPLKKTVGFENIRAGFPLRHEFEAISLPETIFKKHPQLEKLGFRRLL